LKLSLFVLLWVAGSFPAAESGRPEDMACYVGGEGNQKFMSVLRLSDGSFLIGGEADNMDWVPQTAKRIRLGGARPGSEPTSVTPMLIHLSGDLKKILRVAELPASCAFGIRFIRTTTPPGAKKTGDLFISGARNKNPAEEKDKGGYFIARLDGNFVDKAPSKLLWCRNIRATGVLKKVQAWDVGPDCMVTYADGEPYSYNWMAIYRMDGEGKDAIVENWRMHWYTKDDGKGGEYFGSPASKGPKTITKSGIVLKIWGRGCFRSWTREDFLLKTPDGNGGKKMGKWPLDAMFDGYWDPEIRETVPVLKYDKATKKWAPVEVPEKTKDAIKAFRKENKLPGCGYYGYRWGSTPCAAVLCITVDKRNGGIYIGGNNKSRLPDGKPDFEPWVVAMDSTGRMKWWQRLYSEEKGVSTPDQYADCIAIDYSMPPTKGSLVVAARAHGNNVNNLWNGDAVKHPDNPGNGFQNGFTGTHGNMHFSWLGRFATKDGILLSCTYLAEYAEGAKHQDKPFKDDLISHWPHWRAGWPDLNTTRVEPRGVCLDARGNIYVTALGRRVITTGNAFMEMPSPLRDKGSIGNWADFVRVYKPDLAKLLYSSILAGRWDWNTGKEGSGVDISQAVPVEGGLLLVGSSKLDKEGNVGGNEMPTRNIPSWGRAKRTGIMGVVARLHFQAAKP
jgi:hypothetical protein